MKNKVPKFLNKALRSKSSRHYKNIVIAKKQIDSKTKLFLDKTKVKESKTIKSNNRYSLKNPNYFLSPSYSNRKNKIYRSIEIHKVYKDEKSLLTNKNNFTYNEIVALLNKIMEKTNCFDILIKIKNFIHKLIDNTKEKNDFIYSSSCMESPSSKENKNLTCKNRSQRTIRFNNKTKLDDFINDKNNDDLNEKDDKTLNNSCMDRRVKKLYNKINQLEQKSHIEQLKYLFFIVEQEKKIAELEKNFELKEIPLDERIIEQMRELKCYPDFIRTELDLNNYKNYLKGTNEPNLDGLLKSRNKKETKDKDKYSFDKDLEPIKKKNQSVIANKSEHRPKSGKIRYPVKKIDFNSNQTNNINYNSSDNKIKKIEIHFIKPVNQLFNKKKFFVTHPKLNYVKHSLEKNHFLKLKTKEQLSGDTNLLSNMNLASKSQKNAVNEFSSFINNSMANFEKLKN